MADGNYDKRELELVKIFLETQRPQGEIYREVPIGRGFLSQEMRNLAKKHGNLTKILEKRIDLLIKDDKFNIYEAKYRMNAKALGQLLVYRTLLAFERNVPPSEITLNLICRYGDAMIEPTLREYGINIYYV